MSDVKKLYNALLSHGYTSEDLGDENTFTTAMSDAANRKELYDGASANGLDLGDYDEYEKRLTQTSNNIIQATTPEPPKAEEVKPQSRVKMTFSTPNYNPFSFTSTTSKKQDVATPMMSEEISTADKEELTTFGEGVEQGYEGLKAGVQYAAGEAIAPILGTSLDDKAALEEIERLQAEGKDVAKETKNTTTLAQMSPTLDKALKIFGGSKMRNALGGMEKDVERNITIQKALKKTGGDVEQAKKIISGQADKEYKADQWRAEAESKMAQAKPTKGWAWVGSMIPQMAGQVVGLGLSAVTKSPIFAQGFGMANMGLLTASTAGQAMAEARQAGASNSQVWASGIANGAVELLTEKIPYNRYVGRISKTTKDSVSQTLVKAVSEVGSPANKELKDLLSKANKQLGGKLFSDKNVEDFMGDLVSEGLSEATAEGLQTILPIIYENPENYPTFSEIIGNALEGAKGGIFMGAFLGGASKAAEHRMNRARRKAQGYVDVAEVTTPDGKDEVVEVVRNEQNQPVFLWNGEQIPISKNNVKQRRQFNFDDFERGQFQLEEDEAYENGKTLETPAEMTDANNMYEIAAIELAKRSLGLQDQEIDSMSKEDVEGIVNQIELMYGGNPLQKAHDILDTDSETSDLILNYAYAKATRDGIVDAARGRISEETAQAEAIIDYRKNKTDGMIHPATLKAKDANGNDRQVYVVSGNIVTFEDGTINTQESDNAIIIQDVVTGKPEFATAKDLLRAEQAIDPEVEKQNVRNTIADTIATEVENKMNNVLPFNVGDAYNIIGADGAEHSVQVIADNGDGSVIASIDNAEAMAMPKSEIQQLSNEYNMNRARLANEAQKEAKQSEKMMQEAQNVEPTNVVEQTTETPAEVVPERVVPTLKDGNPDFNAMDAEMFVDEYVSRYGEDSAVKIARKNISNARENIAKIDKKIDDITDPNQMEGLYVQRKSAEAQIARYSDILDRLGASEDANETEADQRNRLRNDAGNRIATLFPDGMPNVESVILADIATGNRIRWSDKTTNGAVTSRGLGAELGYTEAERRKRLPLIGKDAMTPEEYAESLRERLDALGVRYDESSLRDAVLSVYQSVDSRKGAWDALENISRRAQEPEKDADWEDMQAQMARNKVQGDNTPALPDMPDLASIEEETPISENENAEMEAQAQEGEQSDYDAMMDEFEGEFRPKYMNLSKEEVDIVLDAMKIGAEIEPAAIELTPENWTSEFGDNGILSTPIGDVKMGEGQYLKLMQRKREKYFGLIKPTLNNPDVVLEEYDPKDGAERDTKLLFVKTFAKEDGRRYVHFESVTVQKESKEVSISSHEVNESDLKKKMHNNNVVHLKDSFFDSEGRLIEPQNEGSDLVPTPNVSSESKDTTSEPKSQEVDEKILQGNEEVEENTTDSANLAEDVTAIESNVDEKPANKPKSDKKIEDFGEKIGGARKDVARARLLDTVKLSAKDLESLKDPDKILSRKAIIKYMEEGQMTENDGISLLALNMATRGKYRKALTMEKYREVALQWERGEDIDVGITEQDIDKYMANMPEAARVKPNARERAISDLERIILTPYNDYRDTYIALNYPAEYRNLRGTYIYKTAWNDKVVVVSGIDSRRGFVFNTYEQAVAKIKRDFPIVEFEKSKEKSAAKDNKDSEGHLNITKDDMGWYRIKSRSIPGNIYLSGRFRTKKDAEAYLEQNKEVLLEREQKMTESLMGSNIGMVEREGVDYRNGQDVTPEDFLNTFGFRGVEFGNWVPQAERQLYLNKTYDAIMDFCNIIGISPKAFSLGGELALAFGARGKSRALAHYEPLKMVINLTRMKGAGSLAHEWFHAFDNYISKRKTGNISDMATARFAAERDEVSRAFYDLVSKMNSMDYTKRSKRAGEYWGEVEERAARLLENYIYNELERKSQVSPLLVRKDTLFNEEEIPEEDYVKSAWPYPSARENKEIKPYFDHLFSTLEEKVDEQGNVILFRSSAPTYDDFEIRFAELQREYDALNKDDEQALNAWRDKKAEVVRSFMEGKTKELNLPTKNFRIVKNKEELRSLYNDYSSAMNKWMQDTNKDFVSIDSFNKFKERLSKAQALYSPVMDVIACDINSFPNDEVMAFTVLFHEQTHSVIDKVFKQKQLKDIWDEALINDAKNANDISANYGDDVYENGNEYLAFILERFTFANFRNRLESFIKGDEAVLVDDLMKNAKETLPLRNEAIKKILKFYNDGYRKERGFRTETRNDGLGRGYAEGSREATTESSRGGSQSSRERRRSEVVEAATDLASSLGVKLNIVESLSDIKDPNVLNRRKKRESKAWYSVTAGEVYLVLPNATSVADAQQSVLHEVVAHKGLRTLFGEQFDQFLDKVYQNADKSIRAKITNLATQNGWNFHTATEEYLASLAEDTNFEDTNPSWWAKIKELFLEMFDKIGIEVFDKVTLTDNELRYILWRSYQKQKAQGAMAVAEDVVMQQKLGVGNFRSRPAGESMTEEEQIIADAKANGTYLKAPNGKKSNLTPKQWVQVRTKAFKKWFGDWEKAARIEKLRKSKDAEITGNEIEASEDLKEYRKNALEYGKTFRGEYVNKDTGEAIVINKDSLTEVLHHDGSNIAHIQSVAAIPQMVESGIYITSEPISETASKKMRNAKMAHYYVCGLKIGDIPYTVKFVVAEFESGEKYYDHSLTEIEKGELLNRAELSSTVADSKSPISDIKDKRLVSILQTNSSKIVDANGEPKVVYHRTPNKFTSFDVEKIGSSTDWGAFGEGFYFSPYAEQYGMYGGNTMALFLNARNPLVLNDGNAFEVKESFLKDYSWGKDSSEAFTKWVKDNGYDAVVYKTDFQEEDIAFNPNQIKSATDNVGTFDANNDDIRFRTTPKSADIEDGEVKGVREAFDKKVRSAWYQTKEAVYDNRQALKEYMRLATKAHGANLPNDDMKHIEAWENPYMAIMQKSSINQKEVESWEKKYYHPILNAIYKIFDVAGKRDVGALRGIFGTDSMDDILNNYLQGKHGLERNRDMAVRNALDEMTKATLITKKEAEEMLEQVNTELQNDIITPTEADARRQQIGNMLATKKFTKEQVQAQTEVWKQRKDAIRNDDTLSWAEKQRALDKIAITEFGVDLAAKDYSGLGEVFPNEDGKLEQSIEDAYTAVEAFEELFDTKDLWDAIKAANNATIEKSFRSGIINKATMDSIRDMYDYYIPLRGFEAATTEDVYGYLNNEPRAFSMPVKRANGRASKAEFAIPHILQMAHSAILQGNNNLVKMKMANFAQHYPTDLIKQSNMYIEYDEVNDVWKAKYAEIPRNATPEEVDALIAEHNEKMAKAVKENPNKYRKVSGKMDVPYIIPKGMDSYHQIPYKRNGVDYVLTVNGDPRLAFVMNGELEKAATTFAGKAGEAVEGFTRFLAGMYTQYNPEFMLSNAYRDGTWVLATVPVRENAKYTAKFYKNYFELIVPGVMQNLFVRYEKGTLDMSNDTHREFANFIKNGGETGYAILKDVENTKKRVSKDIHPSLWSKTMKLIDKLGIVARGVESSARFAAYLASREEGRSITRSAYDAKEVSVNFNRKGAYAAFNDLPTQTLIGQFAGATAGIFKQTHAFFNAGIQGLAGVCKLVKYNPFKAMTAFSSPFLLGMVVASLYDDDDDYYNLSETVRRQNIIIRAGDQYVSIPLAIELRAMYSLGEMAVSYARGKEDFTGGKNLSHKIAEQVMQALPINILEGNGGFDALYPTLYAIINDVKVNEDWQGMPIYREDKYAGDEAIPEWKMVYSYTGRGYIAASKFWSELWGGDEGKRGELNILGHNVAEINPAVAQHIAEGILGGPLSFFDKTVATIDIARGKKDFEWRNIPFASRIIKDGGGKAQQRAELREYNNNKNAYEAMDYQEKEYNKIANDPNRSKEDREKYRLKLEELQNSPEYKQLNDFHEASLEIDKMYRDAKKENALDKAMPDINKKKEEANAILDNK